MPSLTPLNKLRAAIRLLGLPLVLRSLWYQFRKAYIDARYANDGQLTPPIDAFFTALQTLNEARPEPPPPTAFETAGSVLRWTLHGATVTLTCARAAVQVHILAPNLVRVRLSPSGKFEPPFSYAVVKPEEKWPPVDVTVSEIDDRLDIETGQLIVRVHKTGGYIDFLDERGEMINRDSGGLGWLDNWVGLWRSLPGGDPVYGLGERAAGLDRRRGRYEMWNTDPGGQYRPGDDPLYQAQPWLLSLYRGRAFGLFFDNSCRALVDVGQAQADTLSIVGEGGELRYYFFYGPAIPAILERLTELTGRMDLPPLWALGFHQSRWSYYPAEEVYQVANEFRRRKIPCDVIHLDIHHLDAYRSFTWDRDRFPNPHEMMLDLRERGFRVVTIVNPGIKADPHYETARSGLARDVFLKLPNGRLFHGPVWPGECYFPDFSSPAVRAWWGGRYRSLLRTGVAGFWNDMNEPALFGAESTTIPNAVRHDAEGRGASHAEIHNVYGMLMARASLIGLRALRPKRRPLLISRSAFVGVQRYALVWTGDNESTWEHLRLSLGMCLNLGLSGVGFCGPDIGGFAGSPDGELFARWMLAGALLPFCRVHSSAFTARQEPWAFGPEVEAIARHALELRYCLLPYLYTAFWQASQTGLPPMRPLVLAFQDDPACTAIEDQFMVGDDLMAAPVVEAGARQRQVYLPAGSWVDYWTGEGFCGGQTIELAAPLNHLPLFARAGSVIPHYPVIQHTDQAHTLDQLLLHVYPGDGSSDFYEDDGDGSSYRQGHYRRIQFRCRHQDDALTITVRILNGSTTRDLSYVPLYDRLRWVIHLPHPVPIEVKADGLAITDWQIDHQANTLTFETPIVQRLEVWW
ncbi:MAG: glycoside hydrolase family 31 protein [Anaerolineae bacterium]